MTPGSVVVLGEPLVELSSDVPLTEAAALRVSFSGDALNAAAASAAAGAPTAMLSRVGDDVMGERLVRYAAGLGIDVGGVRRGPESTGAYLVGADPEGRRDYVYLRSGSAAAAMRPEDLDPDVLAGAAVLLVSGIAMASSPSLGAAVREAARVVATAGGRVVYDPNHRPQLATAAQSRAHLEALAPSLSVVVPSAPADTLALADTDDPAAAAAALLALGCEAVVVTCGPDGALLATRDGATVSVDPVPAGPVRDATGAGDVFAGTLAAGLASQAPTPELVRVASAAAALSLAGRGGTGRLASRDEVLTLAGVAGPIDRRTPQ